MTFKNRYYPHLLPCDIPVWERFLYTFPNRFGRIEYDVRVGKGRPAPPEMHRVIQKAALDLSRRRIDAIGYTTSEINIIEVTRLADLKAIGQLNAYPLLYTKTYKPTLPLHTILVCEEIHTDIETILATMPVEVWVSPSPDGSPAVT